MNTTIGAAASKITPSALMQRKTLFRERLVSMVEVCVYIFIYVYIDVCDIYKNIYIYGYAYICIYIYIYK